MQWNLSAGEADVVIRPDTAAIGGTDFEARHAAILEGGHAAAAMAPVIREQLAKRASRANN